MMLLLAAVTFLVVGAGLHGLLVSLSFVPAAFVVALVTGGLVTMAWLLTINPPPPPRPPRPV